MDQFFLKDYIDQFFLKDYMDQISIPFHSTTRRRHQSDCGPNLGIGSRRVRVLRGGQLPVTSVGLRYYAGRGFRGRAMAYRGRRATGDGRRDGAGKRGRAPGLLERRRMTQQGGGGAKP